MGDGAIDAELHEVAVRDAEDDARAFDRDAADHLPEDHVPELPALADVHGRRVVEHELRVGNPEEARG